MRYLINLALLILLLIACSNSSAFGQEPIKVSQNSFPLSIGKNLAYFIDSNNSYTPNNILTNHYFIQSSKNVPIFLLPDKNIWVKFYITNNSEKESLYLDLRYSNINLIELFEVQDNNKLIDLEKVGNIFSFDKRTEQEVNFNFRLGIQRGETKSYYLRIRSTHPLELPFVLNDITEQAKSNTLQSSIIALYTGLIIAVLLYNLFLYFSIKDRNYLLYVFYLLFLYLAQLTFSGWSFKVLWPNEPQLNYYSVICTSAAAGITGLLFAKFFLHTSYYTPRFNKLINLLIGFYILAIACIFLQKPLISYTILNYNGLLGGIILIIVSILILRKGFRPAAFYLVAWSLFLIALIIFVLRNLGVVPTNNFTRFSLFFGSAIEAILLSIALADKINVLQKEKEVSQAEALKISQENETLVREQNIVLERRVTERTEKLAAANDQLNHTLNDLKDAQAQLVDAEKMASLGQLTAGIAHEINNPINFVKSNIKPLQLDINDLFHVIDQYDVVHSKKDGELQTALKSIDQFKKEIDIDYVKTEIKNLIKGIEEGAERTAEIVRGLRTFSRLDEAELKAANVHDGLDSTLVLLKNSIPPHIKIVKNYKANGEIECYAGKLNQVFMNIINNGVQAILGKKQQDAEEYITISTRDIPGDKIEISIKDSGMGMTEEVKQKIFEPFFTTKAVGEGTGLGMAIVFKIIENHHAKININSSPGNGAEFILTLPHMQPLS